MSEAKYYLEIKDKKVPVIVRNYKNSNHIKLFFRGDILNISKPRYVKYEEVMKMIKQNEENIYKQYIDILSSENQTIKHWDNGEKIVYQGKKFCIQREECIQNQIEVIIDEQNQIFKISMPYAKMQEEDIKKYVDKAVKNLFKQNTTYIIQQKLPYWSQKMQIPYTGFKVRDAITKYGSCKPGTKELYFSSRLIMLPPDKIDAIVVHELCHIIYRNHSQEFYDLVKTYIPDYQEIDKWLKEHVQEMVI